MTLLNVVVVTGEGPDTWCVIVVSIVLWFPAVVYVTVDGIPCVVVVLTDSKPDSLTPCVVTEGCSTGEVTIDSDCDSSEV